LFSLTTRAGFYKNIGSSLADVESLCLDHFIPGGDEARLVASE